MFKLLSKRTAVQFQSRYFAAVAVKPAAMMNYYKVLGIDTTATPE